MCRPCSMLGAGTTSQFIWAGLCFELVFCWELVWGFSPTRDQRNANTPKSTFVCFLAFLPKVHCFCSRCPMLCLSRKSFARKEQDLAVEEFKRLGEPDVAEALGRHGESLVLQGTNAGMMSSACERMSPPSWHSYGHLSVVSAAHRLLFSPQPKAGCPSCGFLPLSNFSPTGAECHCPPRRDPAWFLASFSVLCRVSPTTPPKLA